MTDSGADTSSSKPVQSSPSFFYYCSVISGGMGRGTDFISAGSRMVDWISWQMNGERSGRDRQADKRTDTKTSLFIFIAHTSKKACDIYSRIQINNQLNKCKAATRNRLCIQLQGSTDLYPSRTQSSSPQVAWYRWHTQCLTQLLSFLWLFLSMFSCLINNLSLLLLSVSLFFFVLTCTNHSFSFLSYLFSYIWGLCLLALRNAEAST